MTDKTSITPRSGKELFNATIPFAEEFRALSWWYVGSTLATLIAVLTVAAIIPWWPLRLAASITGGLLFVRVFILYHDFMHGSLLSGSRLAHVMFYSLGLLMLAPPRHWRYSHNFHHAHVGKVIVANENAFPVITSDIGSYPLMSTESWQTATVWQRLRYRISRNPLSIICAYATIFLLVSCLKPLMRDPRKYWDAAFSLLAHCGLIALLWLTAGFDVAFFAFVLPFVIASALGAYLFYVQHTFEGLHIFPAEKWTYFDGALESSSYLKLNRVMSWFTGNIGYHHVHHLNSRIPFYRLPEAMAAIPELQHPTVISLCPHDIVASFCANLWETSTQRMVSYRKAISPPKR